MNSQQKYYETHKEKCKQISKDWKAANPEKVKEYAKAYFPGYYDGHKEKFSKANKKYYNNNSDKVKAKIQEYWNKNYNSGVMASRMGNRGCPVLCIETGEIFDSAAEASRYMNRARSAIAASIHLGHKCAGYTWRYLTKDEIDHFDGDL